MTRTAPAAGSDHRPVDIAVIGGGINGAGIARDAGGRGLRVLLCEKGDLAEGTSSRSGKLVHGGLPLPGMLRVSPRARGLDRAGSPARLRAPYHLADAVRAAAFPGAAPGLAYTGRVVSLRSSRRPQATAAEPQRRSRARCRGRPLRSEFRRGFEYSDCWVDDARLVILNLIDASHNGARILPRTKAVRARRASGAWQLDMQGEDGGVHTVRARVLVNAAGPWVQDVGRVWRD